MNTLLRTLEKFIPRSVYTFFQPAYHYLLALTGAIIYRFPSRKINVVAITGTKGKTSSVEFVNSMLEAAGHKTAVISTLRFKVGNDSRPNLYKMSLPGRFFVQSFLRQAVNAGCTYIVMEITSEAVKQYRHKFIELDALIFTNIAPEHIESHGSFENYLAAKLELPKAVANSSKKNTVIVANTDDAHGKDFLTFTGPTNIGYSLKDADPYTLTDGGTSFTFKGHKMHTFLAGKFNLYNILGAATYAQTQGVTLEQITNAVADLKEIKGRLQRINFGQNFEVIVDYAHTAESLENLYQTFPDRRKIGVLGNTGGGRDVWKRPEMAKVADNYCDEIILTNEDPYNDDPRKIVEDMQAAIHKHPVEIIMDRREAIAEALKRAQPGDVVLITGKGTDPYIMTANNTKIPWSDAKVAEEELRKLLSK